MKNVFRIVGIVTLLLLASSLARAASFPDVPASHPNSDAIEYVKTNGIVSWYDDGTYKPDRKIDRAEFIKIIIGAQFSASVIDGCIAENIGASSKFAFFPDVLKTAWFAKYLCVAKMHTILNGYPDGTFQASNQISFIEAAKIIGNTFGYSIIENTPWYRPFVEKLADKNAIPTTITGFVYAINRGEMAEIVYRLRANITSKASLNYESISEMATSCIDQTEGTPVITSLSVYSGTGGTRLKIRGCNFAGFEGDKNAWIENTLGTKGILSSESGSTSKLLNITLRPSLCQTDTSYSDLECEKWLDLTPGQYQIYVMPWGKISNKMDFTIVPDSGVSGKVLLGPACPVMMYPPDPNCADKVYQTTIEISTINGTSTTPYSTIATDTHGQFTAKLLPGEYALHPVGGTTFPICETKKVTIASGEMTTVDFSCDTGIR